MKAMVALVASIVSAAVAIGIVSVDLMYTMTAAIDVRENGTWATVQSYPENTGSRSYFGHGPGCPVNDLRIRIDNDRPITASVDVIVRYSSEKTNGHVILYEEKWNLAPFEERVHEFRIPDTAFPTSTSATPTPYVTVDAEMGGRYPLNVCVTRGSAS